MIQLVVRVLGPSGLSDSRPSVEFGEPPAHAKVAKAPRNYDYACDILGNNFDTEHQQSK